MRKIKTLAALTLAICMNMSFISHVNAAENVAAIYPNEMRVNGNQMVTRDGYVIGNYVTANGAQSSYGSTNGYEGVDDIYSSSVRDAADLFDAEQVSAFTYHAHFEMTQDMSVNFMVFVTPNYMIGTANHNALTFVPTGTDVLGTYDASLPIIYEFYDGTKVKRADILAGTVAMPDFSNLKTIQILGNLSAGTVIDIALPYTFAITDPSLDNYSNMAIGNYTNGAYETINLNLLGITGNQDVRSYMTDQVLPTIAKEDGTYEVVTDPDIQAAMPVASTDFIKYSIFHIFRDGETATVDKYGTDLVTNFQTGHMAIKTETINDAINSLGYVTQVDGTRVMPVLRYSNYNTSPVFVNADGSSAQSQSRAFYVSMHKVIDAQKTVEIKQDEEFNAATYYLGGTDPITGAEIAYDDLTVNSNVDNTTPGTYTVVYGYTLQDGTAVSRTLNVTVKEKEKPVENPTDDKKDEQLSFSVSAKWNDNNNKKGTRPEEITVELLADGTKCGTALLYKGNNWTNTWEGVPKYASAKTTAKSDVVVYRVYAAENGLVKYTVQAPKVKGYTVKVSGDTSKGFTVTYTLNKAAVNNSGKTNTGSENGMGYTIGLMSSMVCIIGIVLCLKKKLSVNE